jgi:ABC-2 type transport system permease protein
MIEMNSLNFMRKYLWVALTSARSNLAYLGEVSGRVIFLAVILYIFLCLWKETYGCSGNQQLGGLSINQMLWYLTITEAILLSAPKVSQLVDEDVRTGSFATYLVRPMSYPMYRLASTLGERSVRFVSNLLAGSAVTALLVGPGSIEPTGFLFLLLALPLAFVIDFLGTFLVGLGAFWIEDTSGLFLIYSRGTMIIGGALLPIELYPTSVQQLLKVLPFANVVYGPAKLFVNPSLTELVLILSRQLLGVAVLGAAVYFTYRVAQRRVFINGG